LLIALAAAGASFAQTPASPDVEAEPVAGQLDVLQGTAVQLGGTSGSTGLKPSSYLWEIVEGRGAIILRADRADAIFQAPKLTDADMETFVIQLTVTYPGQESATARMLVRVHREMPTPKKREPTIEEVMRDQYAREAEARRNRRSSGTTTVVHHGPSMGWGAPGWGWGWGGPGWGWGWSAHYPIHVPIVVPPPGSSQGPGDIDLGNPVAVPYDEMVTTFPEEIADNYLPQDNPMADPIPDSAFGGSNPADFMAPPDMGGIGAEPMIMDDPGFGGGGFDEPMIDPGFGFDDFGW
jgi:hypothetical protein